MTASKKEPAKLAPAGSKKTEEEITTANIEPEIIHYYEEDRVSNVVIAAVEALWNSVHELTRLRPTAKSVYLVTIFGSARIQPGSEAYERVADLAEKLTRLGGGKIGIVTGGGPGLMQAANEGVARVRADSSDHSIGLKIALDFEKEANPFVAKVYEHKDFFSRLHQFVILSDAYIVVEGGIGSLLELSLVWQLLQVRKLYNTPFILLAPMWKALLQWATKWMVEDSSPQLAGEIDMKIPITPDTTDEAIAIIEKDMLRWLKEQDQHKALRCPVT